jgi:hypothetical protein
MKRPVLLTVAILFALLIAAGSASAQSQEDPQVFVKTVPIMKVLAHPLGYKVLYVKSSMEVVDFYVPYSWFKPGGKAEVVFGAGRSYPFFSAFYMNGQFDHIKLYLVESMGHVSWGTMKRSEGDSRRFEIETLDLEY